MRGRCCWATCTGRWMTRSASRSSRRAVGTRSRSSNWPRSSNLAELAGGYGLPGSRPVASQIETSYERRLRVLPPEARLLVLAAAAEPLGDPALLRRAGEWLGIEMAQLAPAVDAGLITVDGRVEFTHPLVRSAAYRTAAADDRRRVQHALAEGTDPETDPDRRAWHRASSTPGPDEEVASELERSAARAQARGGVAAAAAFLRRAVEQTRTSRCAQNARWPPRRRVSRLARSRRRLPRSRPRRRGSSTTFGAPRQSSCAATSPWSRATARTLRRCCSRRRRGSSRSTSGWLAWRT